MVRIVVAPSEPMDSLNQKLGSVCPMGDPKSITSHPICALASVILHHPLSIPIIDSSHKREWKSEKVKNNRPMRP